MTVMNISMIITVYYFIYNYFILNGLLIIKSGKNWRLSRKERPSIKSSKLTDGYVISVVIVSSNDASLNDVSLNDDSSHGPTSAPSNCGLTNNLTNYSRP